eukprot:TRINITY_DN623_c0_g1_i1.p1 TRINITY_DN623_c0_g1~~TRINITY_DN623_c0_g1_i1.p1  ORF type:complete len:572 (+),score=191.09 TRINITY_DN623_c0_g1_i1:52-1716(+)
MTSKVDHPFQDTKFLTVPSNVELLKKLPGPQDVFGYFLLATEVPRPSGSVEKMAEMVIAIAKAHSLPVEKDKVGNVVIHLPATKGLEKAPTCCVQCHMDMVPTKLSESKHDFSKDPIELLLDGKYLKANGTTLGGDDGAGVAACLALATRTDYEHGPLDLLFTVDEETTMSGAENIAPYPFLKSTMMINVDSEEDHEVCVGCAGGMEKKLFFSLQRDKSFSASKFTLIDLDIDGLLGGHSGVDIHQGRANAAILLARLLAYVKEEKKINMQIVEFKAGNAPNAIPRQAAVQLYILSTQLSLFKEGIHKQFETLKSEYRLTESTVDEKNKEAPRVPKMKASLKEKTLLSSSSTHTLPLTEECTQKFLDLLLVAPHGPIRMSAEVSGEVETSLSLGFVQLPMKKEEEEKEKEKEKSKTKEDKEEALLHWLIRSSSNEQMAEVSRKLNALARLTGTRISTPLGVYPGWQPDLRSRVLKETIKAHQTLFKKPPHRVYAVHAGLECGFFQKTYPKLDAVSIGPTVLGAHTTDERLDIESVPSFFSWLLTTIKNVAELKD